MPGIVGIVTRTQRREAEDELLRMVAALQHESFYYTGTWTDERLGLYIGWVARENSFCDRMPLFNERADVVLVFSGEEFPEPGTARHLKERGHDLDIEGASYLVHLYEDDPTFPASLNGRFHGLLVDQTRGTATLFNDRYGMHRIYYHESKEAFYFSAEAKAILAVRPELRRISPRGLGEFVACGCVLENRSVFRDVHVLPPASDWVFRNGSVVRHNTYFQPRDWEAQDPLQSEEFYTTLKEVFSRIVPRYFAGRERIAMSLTGGLDSRMLMAWHKPFPASLPCYTFGGDGRFRQCQDAMLAQKVARACNQSHEIIAVGQEFLHRFSHYAERTVYLTDGCLALTYSPDLYLNERAREIAPVRMTGNYGSEVLRRSRAFKPVHFDPGLFSADLATEIAAAEKTYSHIAACHPVSFAVFRQAPWHHYGLLALEQTQLALRSPYLDNELVQTVFRAPDAMDDIKCLRLIADGNPSLLRVRTDRGLAGNANGVSATLRRFVLEFLFKAEYGYDEGMPQWVASVDKVLSALRLERLFLGTHKFHHFRVWYRDDLSGYVREMLMDPRTLSRPFLQRRGVERIVIGHLKGNRNYTSEIHKLLTLELLHRLFIEDSPWPASTRDRAAAAAPPLLVAGAVQHQ